MDATPIMRDAKGFWTEERVVFVRKEWLSGRSASQIASALGSGVTRNAVIGKVHRMGLGGRGPSPSRAGTVTSVAKAIAGMKPAQRPSTPQRMGGAAVALKPVMRAQPASRPELKPEPVPLKIVVRNQPNGGNIGILQLSDKTCRWPIGDPGVEGFCFCGHGPKVNSPYCDYHSERAFQPPPDRRPRREDPPLRP